MADIDVTQLITNGGFGAGLLGILYLIGNRMVRAIDRLIERVGNHHAEDSIHHTSAAEKLDTLLERKRDSKTPIVGVPIYGKGDKQ